MGVKTNHDNRPDIEGLRAPRYVDSQHLWAAGAGAGLTRTPPLGGAWAGPGPAVAGALAGASARSRRAGDRSRPAGIRTSLLREPS